MIWKGFGGCLMVLVVIPTVVISVVLGIVMLIGAVVEYYN